MTRTDGDLADWTGLHWYVDVHVIDQPSAAASSEPVGPEVDVGELDGDEFGSDTGTLCRSGLGNGQLWPWSSRWPGHCRSG